MAKKKENAVLNTVILVVISLVAVALLAIVNQITSEPISKAEAQKKAEAYESIYTGCAEFGEIDNLDTLISQSEDLLNNEGLSGCTIEDAMSCKNENGDIEGYVITSTTNSGYGGEIKIAIGIKDNKLTGFEVLSNSESPGFGANCTKPEFSDQFTGKSASILTVTKTGSASDTEIDAISGATITSDAIAQAVNAAIVFYQQELCNTVSSNTNTLSDASASIGN